jgi:hypothetical protein
MSNNKNVSNCRMIIGCLLCLICLLSCQNKQEQNSKNYEPINNFHISSTNIDSTNLDVYEIEEWFKRDQILKYKVMGHGTIESVGYTMMAIELQLSPELFLDQISNIKATAISSGRLNDGSLGLCNIGEFKIPCIKDYKLPDIYHNTFFLQPNYELIDWSVYVGSYKKGVFSKINNPYTDNREITTGYLIDWNSKRLIKWYLII